MNFTIEDNVPFPSFKRSGNETRTTALREALSVMTPGQSFAVTSKTGNHSDIYATAKVLGKPVTIRRVDKHTYRVWLRPGASPSSEAGAATKG